MYLCTYLQLYILLLVGDIGFSSKQNTQNGLCTQVTIEPVILDEYFPAFIYDSSGSIKLYWNSHDIYRMLIKYFIEWRCIWYHFNWREQNIWQKIMIKWISQDSVEHGESWKDGGERKVSQMTLRLGRRSAKNMAVLDSISRAVVYLPLTLYILSLFLYALMKSSWFPVVVHFLPLPLSPRYSTKAS